MIYLGLFFTHYVFYGLILLLQRLKRHFVGRRSTGAGLDDSGVVLTKSGPLNLKYDTLEERAEAPVRGASAV